MMIGTGLALMGAVAALHGAAHDAARPCPAGTPVQTIAVVNQANVRPAALRKVERAITDQSIQVRAAWGTPCVQFGQGGWVANITTGQSVRNPDGSTSDPVSGTHPVLDGQPTIDIQTGGNPYAVWSRDFSHEVVEALEDPYDNKPWTLGRLLEIADPVEGLSYSLDGVQVTDFAFPSFFDGGPGPWDQMGALTTPG